MALHYAQLQGREDLVASRGQVEAEKWERSDSEQRIANGGSTVLKLSLHRLRVPSTLVALDHRLDATVWKNAPFTLRSLRLSTAKSDSRTLRI